MTMEGDQMEDMIWKYIDKTCTDSEKTEIENLLAQNKDAAKLYKELNHLDATIQSQLITVAPDSITQSILLKIQYKSTIKPASFNIVPVMLFALLLLGLTVFFLPDVHVYEMPSIDWSFLHVEAAIPQVYTAYILGTLAAVSLIWFDYIFSKRAILKNR